MLATHCSFHCIQSSAELVLRQQVINMNSQACIILGREDLHLALACTVKSLSQASTSEVMKKI